MAARKTTASKTTAQDSEPEQQPGDDTTSQDGGDGVQTDTAPPADTTANPEPEGDAPVDPDPAQPPADPADPDPDEEQRSGDPKPCTACFPSGWPAPDVTGLGCEHGTWQRPAAG